MWKCHKCGKPVYFAERKQSLGYDWHPECLRCEECGKRLNPGQHAEHKGVPYCHVPCYGALFGPQLFGHGTRVESHKNFGQKGTQRTSSGPVLARDQLESKLKTYNQFFDNKSMEIRSREVNNRLVLEGALRVYWGVHAVIHLKEDDDQRTVVTVRKRNSCRYGNTIEVKNVGDNLSDKENENTDTGIDTTTCSAVDGYSTDISMSESMTFDSCSISEEIPTDPTCSSAESSPTNKSNSATLPTKLDVKNIEWNEIDDLLQVERKIDESEKLYQTMPSPLSNSKSLDENNVDQNTLNSKLPKIVNENNQNNEVVLFKDEDILIEDEATLKPTDFEDFKRSVHEQYLNGTSDLTAASVAASQNDDTLKSNQPIDPSRINDSLKLYGENVMSKSFNCEAALRTIDAYLINDTLTLKPDFGGQYHQSNARSYILQKSGSATSTKFSQFHEGKLFFEKGINRSKSGPNCFMNTDSDEEATLKPSTIRRNEILTQFPKHINIKMDCYDQNEAEKKAKEEDKKVPEKGNNPSDNTNAEEQQKHYHSKESESESITEDGVVLRRPPKTGASAIKRRSGNKRTRAKLKRRCSINGHFYNRETSFFTPPHGSQMSVWVTSLVNTNEVINLLLEKYKVDSRPENFSLFIVRDNGEQKRLRDDDYPLVVRVMLGPHEDVARIFLMDSQETQEISSEVAQFLNLSIPECRAILERYDEEHDREVTRIKAKYAEMRQRIVQRMESLKVRL